MAKLSSGYYPLRAQSVHSFAAPAKPQRLLSKLTVCAGQICLGSSCILYNAYGWYWFAVPFSIRALPLISHLGQSDETAQQACC